MATQGTPGFAADRPSMPPTSLTEASRALDPGAFSAVAERSARAVDFAASRQGQRSKQPRARSPRLRVLLATTLPCVGFLRSMSDIARQRDWNLLTDMLYTGDFPSDCHADAAIVLVRHPSKLSSCVRSMGWPSATVDLSGASRSDLCVVPDNAAIGALAAQHLMDRDYHSFAWAPFADDIQCQEIARGFASRLAERGMSLRALRPSRRHMGALWDEDPRQWRAEIRRYLKILPCRTAILASNDCVAAQIAECCREVGRALPDDIGILGIGNDPVACEATRIGISSVDLDYESMAGRAADIIAGLLSGEPVERAALQIRPKEIAIRGSTGIPKTSNPRIDQAVERINEQFADPNFDINAIVDVMAVSRRQLERDFRASMQCSIREYIERKRMKEASRLLPNEGITVAEVSQRVGIVNVGSFFRAFRRRFGVTPNAYRQRMQTKNTA